MSLSHSQQDHQRNIDFATTVSLSLLRVPLLPRFFKLQLFLHLTLAPPLSIAASYWLPFLQAAPPFLHASAFLRHTTSSVTVLTAKNATKVVLT
jgi:hypothetical protein